MKINAYGAVSPNSSIKEIPNLERREVGENDLLVDILYCGVCHSDIHMARSEWGPTLYPIVPGHEIVGKVIQVGAKVTKFKVGDTAGIGVFVDSCKHCQPCKEGWENYCEEGMTGTYGGYYRDGKTPTYGGYSDKFVIDEHYALQIPFADEQLPGVAPLLCAGITTYSPLVYANIKKGDKVAVLGLGGLGHMGVKFAVAMGAEVTMLSTSPSKKADAEKLGAHHFVLSTDQEALDKLKSSFDVILNTVAAKHDLNKFLNLLKLEGKMMIVGIPSEDNEFAAAKIISKRRAIIGSMIGGIKETQEMLNYCAEKNILSEVEVIPMQNINEAYERVVKADVKYRFVIDMKSIK